MRCRGLIALLIWGQSVAAADLGTWGDLWPVKEPDMLTVIMQRLTALEQSGEMGRKMDAFKERVIRNSLRPPAVPGIGRTEKYGSRLFDPSVRLAADIRDNEGRVTGSLVFGPNGEITPLSARTTDRSIIRAMMEGGTAKIYHCNDSDKCLKVVADTPVTISRDNALKSQITKLLASIQNKAVSDTPLDDKEKGFISSTTIPVFKYLVDPQMLGVSNSMIYQLTDYIGYDILLQYIQELIQQARAMVATGNYDEAVIEHINDNMNDATRQIAAFQSQVQVQQDALLVVDRQMSYMRQQLSARMLSRYQNNYHFGGSTL
ncbi:TPA: conjugal transfer protein TraH [Escherichia coli]|nr:conjugal transfer protein TraH [Escherichia coli]